MDAAIRAQMFHATPYARPFVHKWSGDGRPVAIGVHLILGSKGGAQRAPSVPEIQTSGAVSRSSEEGKRTEAELERETGYNAPSTKQSVEFIYRLT